MIASLAKNQAWSDSISDDLRAEIVAKLRDALPHADSPREIASISKALASLEKNDIDRARLLMDADAVESSDGPQDEARRLLADLNEIDRIEGRKC